MSRRRQSTNQQSAAVNWAIGMLLSPRGVVNIYKYGAGLITILTFILALGTAETPVDAVIYIFDFYYSRLVPPLIGGAIELLTADSWFEFAVTHVVTIFFGVSVAAFKYDMNT